LCSGHKIEAAHGVPQKKAPPFGQGHNSPIYFNVNARAPLSANFHTWFSHSPTLLDCDIGLADAPADRHIGGTGAAFAA